MIGDKSLSGHPIIHFLNIVVKRYECGPKNLSKTMSFMHWDTAFGDNTTHDRCHARPRSVHRAHNPFG